MKHDLLSEKVSYKDQLNIHKQYPSVRPDVMRQKKFESELSMTEKNQDRRAEYRTKSSIDTKVKCRKKTIDRGMDNRRKRNRETSKIREK